MGHLLTITAAMEVDALLGSDASDAEPVPAKTQRGAAGKQRKRGDALLEL